MSKDDIPLPRIEEVRYCGCGTKLSSYNTGKQCSRCQSNEARIRAERVGSKQKPDTRRSWARELTLQPAPDTAPPALLERLPAVEELSPIVAYECGVSVADLTASRHGGFYRRQVARTIFIYLVYKDICKTHQFKPAAAALNTDPQRVRYAKVSIEDELPRREITDAIARVRSYYQHAAASAA